MTPEQPEALRVALEVVALLDRLEIAYHLGGSYASSVHGIPRQTQDVDLVVDIDDRAVADLLELLPPEYYRDAASARAALRTRTSFNLIHLPSGVKLDLFVAGSGEFDREELARSREIRLSSAPDRPLRVKSAEDTILRKLQWFEAGGEVSDRQWKDVMGIFAAQGETLDFEYLERWAAKLGLEALLRQARSDRSDG